MDKVNYSLYLFKIISKKWGLYFVSLISFVAILTIYLSTINKTHSDLSWMREHAPKEVGNIPSGLISNPMTLVIVFVSQIPFIVYLTWIIFISTNNSSELVVFSKKINRSNIILQRFVVAMALIFMDSLFMLINFAIVASKDEVLNSTERVKWIFSMFIGYLVSGICLSAISLLLTNIMKLLPLTLTMITFFSALPIATIVLSDDEGSPSKEWLEKDAANIFLTKRITSEPVLFARPAVGSEIVDDPQSKNFSIYYNGIQEVVNMGAHKTKKPSKYKSYSKWDSWMGASSLFRAFTMNKNSVGIHGSWTTTKTLGDIYNFNENNSIKIGDVNYIKLDGYQEFDRDVQKPYKLIVPNVGALYDEREYSQHFSNVVKHYEYLESPFRPGFFEPKWVAFAHLNSEQIKNNYVALMNELKTNDLIASEYKELSMVEQSAIFERLARHYDMKKPIAQIFNDIKNELTDNNIIKWFSNFGFDNVKLLITKDKDRFTPNTVYPKRKSFTTRLKVETDFSEGRSSHDIPIFKGLISSNMVAEEPHYNEEYKAGAPIVIIWLTLLIMAIPASVIIYTRKDFN